MMPSDADRVIRHSDAVLATIDEDGRPDESGFQAAVLAAGRDNLLAQLVAIWADVLACTHDAQERPLAAALEQVGDQQVRSVVHRTSRAMINLSRLITAETATQVAQDLSDKWSRFHATASGEEIDTLLRVMAVTVKPVLGTMGSLNYFVAATGLIHEFVPADRVGRNGGPVGAALCAAATGHFGAATRYLCLPEDIRDVFGILVSLAPGLMRNPGTTAVALDQHGNPQGVVDLSDPDLQIQRELLAALAAQDPVRIRVAVQAIAALSMDRFLMLVTNLTVSLGAALARLFARLENQLR